MGEDIESAKAALWRRLFGADLSPALVAALHYVDVKERLVRLTSGGWVRDEGDRLLASGGDPQVVALLVEAVKAKGWKIVRIWGDAAFLREARRQLEAAGILVIVADEAPPVVRQELPNERSDRPNADDIEAHFECRRAAAQSRLEDLLTEPPPAIGWEAAIAAKKAAHEARCVAQDQVRKVRDVLKRAEKDLSDAAIWRRHTARRDFDEARLRLQKIEAEFSKAAAEFESASECVVDLQRRHKAAVQRRREDTEPAWRRAVDARDLALECLATLHREPHLAEQGAEAIERATEARVAAEQNHSCASQVAEMPSQTLSSSVIAP